MTFDVEGVRAWVDEVRGLVPAPALWRLATALDRITELEAALAAAEGARLAAERGLAGEGT